MVNIQQERPRISDFLDGIDTDNRESIDHALEIAESFAVTPISGFGVGALAIGRSGKVYLGANMEFTGVPLSSSLHAEQSAVINAWMHGESEIMRLHISQTPCGHCRQFLWELPNAGELEIVTKTQRASLLDLMPMPFGRVRSKGHSLLDSPPRPLVHIRPNASDADQRAINAASNSYTPYTNSPEGFIIESMNGHHFAGRAVESVAFNPSVPAVISALNQMNLSPHRDDSISRCTHAKLATALEHSLTFSRTIMSAICNARVESVLMETVD